MKLIVRLVAASLVLVSVPALAAEAEKYEKKTVINFEDDTIQGDLTKPDGEFVDSRKKVSYTNLIKVREEFREEVLESVGEL